jgi:hypothetical protein
MKEIRVLSESERNWAMFCHLSAFAGFVIFFIPFAGIITTLICWSSRKNESTWVNENGKASMNFQLSILLYLILVFPLCFIIIGIPIAVAIGTLKIVCVIIASVRASKGEEFKYPLSIPFIQ